MMRREPQYVRGASAHNAKLTDDQVRVIRQRWRSGEVLQVVLAREYGISTTVICHIIHGHLWKHVTDEEGGR
jgi:hypothetical protein